MGLYNHKSTLAINFYESIKEIKILAGGIYQLTASMSVNAQFTQNTITWISWKPSILFQKLILARH